MRPFVLSDVIKLDSSSCCAFAIVLQLLQSVDSHTPVLQKSHCHNFSKLLFSYFKDS